MTKEKQIEELAKICCYICEYEVNGKCDNDREIGTCAMTKTTAEHIYNAGYRKENAKYMLKADGSLEMIPTVESVIAKYKALVKQDLIDKGLYLAVTKNALDKAEKEILKGE